MHPGRERICDHCRKITETGRTPEFLVIAPHQVKELIVDLHTENYLSNSTLIRRLENFLCGEIAGPVSLFGLQARLGTALAVY